MDENSYQEYKEEKWKRSEKAGGLKRGKLLLIAGICAILYAVLIFPFHADNAGKIHGDEIKAGNPYGFQRVCYIENLQILYAKVYAREIDEIYCVARFSDCDRKEWLICVTFGDSDRLAGQIKALSTREDRYSGVVEKYSYTLNLADRSDLSVSGYFQMQRLTDLPSEVFDFYATYNSQYLDTEDWNELFINAKYLCDEGGNYTAEVLLNPGILLRTFVAGLSAILFGVFLLMKNRALHRP